jgi:ABC-type uncharacterized transport system permease subunit
VVELGWWGVPIGVIGGAIRVSTPFLFVSLGECITERSGRINLGLEGILVMGAMSGYAVSYTSGNPWLGVLAAGGAGLLLGLLHGLACNLPKVNDIASGSGSCCSAPGSRSFWASRTCSRRRRPCPPYHSEDGATRRRSARRCR